MKSYDVIIIGAGLGGLQCARLLGRAGASVLLVDRKRALNEAIHTTGIFVRRTLEDFSLPEDCLGPPVRHVTLYSPGRKRSVELESPLDEFRVGRMGELYQRFLDECLKSGVAWSPETRYKGCEAESDSTSIIHLETNGLTRSVETRYLVGADGARSRVARDLRLDENQEWIVGVEDLFHDAPTSGPPRFHCFLDPKLAPGYIAWVVQDGLETHVGVGGYARDFDAVSALEKFHLSIRDKFDFSRARRVERRGGRIPVGGVLRHIASKRGLLVGDAAGAVSPLTAGGLDPCMRLSALASDVIKNLLSTGDEGELERYSGDAFRARFVSRLWMRRTLASIRQPLLLEAGCAVLGLPLFKQIAWHVFFGRGSFPDVDGAQRPKLAPEKALS